MARFYNTHLLESSGSNFERKQIIEVSDSCEVFDVQIDGSDIQVICIEDSNNTGTINKTFLIALIDDPVPVEDGFSKYLGNVLRGGTIYMVWELFN